MFMDRENVNHLSIIKSQRTLRVSHDGSRHLKTFSVPVFKLNTKAALNGEKAKWNGMFRRIQWASYSTPCLAYSGYNGQATLHLA